MRVPAGGWEERRRSACGQGAVAVAVAGDGGDGDHSCCRRCHGTRLADAAARGQHHGHHAGSAACRTAKEDAEATPYGRALHWLFRKRLGLLLAARGPLALATDARSGRLVGVVGAMPPGFKPSLPTMISHGLLAWPCLFGVGSFVRALYVDAVLAAPAPDEWEVVMMGVAPSHQGRGVGSRLMRALLGEIARRSSADAKVHLTTQLEINVAYYRKLGFVLEELGQVGHPAVAMPPVRVWSMRLHGIPPSTADDTAATAEGKAGPRHRRSVNPGTHAH